jgi:hypothetical protein
MLLEEIENQLVALSVDQNFPPIFRTFFDDLKKKNGQLSKLGGALLLLSAKLILILAAVMSLTAMVYYALKF